MEEKFRCPVGFFQLNRKLCNQDPRGLTKMVFFGGRWDFSFLIARF